MTIKNIFLSYGRGDDEPFVAEMWEYLTDKGIFAWYDRKNMPSRGEAFTKEIADAIEQSERLILFIGAYSANSEWCEREWKHAYKFCIPITVVLIQHTFATLPNDIKSKFYDDILDVDSLEFPLHLRDNADEKLYNKLTNAENLPLAEPINVPPLQIYMDRPEYIATIKKQMRLSDPTDIKDFRTGIVAITSKDATTGVNGIAGIGKTTLASALAQDCNIRRNFQHILWIRVGNDKKRTDAPALLRAIADQLNPYEDQFKDQYLNEDTARIRVQSLLSDKRVLLILDDVWDRNLLEVFLFTAKTYKLVMTTRNRNLMHENMVEIDRLSDQDGVRLMTYYLNESAPQDVVIMPEFEQIVQTLHGHTLAIKIIATLLKNHGVYEASAYLDRLRDLKHKHLFSYLAEEENLTGDTQRNYDVELSFSLSYEKLTDDQKRRFRAIGIFAPNATYSIEALQAVWEIDDHLLAKQATTALRNVGLLDYDVNTGQYSNHPLLRAYALKLLNDIDEYEIVAGLYVDFYYGLYGNEKTNDNKDIHKQITQDFENILHAMDIAFEHRSKQFCDFVIALRYYMNIYISVEIRYSLFMRAWDVAKELDNEKVLADALRGLQHTMFLKKDYQIAGNYAQEALRIYQKINHKKGMGDIYRALGRIQLYLEEVPSRIAVEGYLTLAYRLYQENEDELGVAHTLLDLGFAVENIELAQQYFEEAIKIYAKYPDYTLALANAKRYLGEILRNSGNIYDAKVYFEQALKLYRDVIDKKGEYMTLYDLSRTYFLLRDRDLALVYANQSLELTRLVNDKDWEDEILGFKSEYLL